MADRIAIRSVDLVEMFDPVPAEHLGMRKRTTLETFIFFVFGLPILLGLEVESGHLFYAQNVECGGHQVAEISVKRPIAF